MPVLHLNGRVTESGVLEVQLPENLPPGEARITIELPAEAWAPGEIEELLRVEPMDGAEIVKAGLTGGWKDQGIIDGQEWLEEQRHQRSIHHQW